VLAVTCLAVFITILDGTIVNVALPSLSRELGASTRQLQWVVDAYLLVFTALLLAAGNLGDRWGRRKVLAVGLVAFAGVSAFAGSAPSADWLIVARALMGIGAALIFPATLAIITNTFEDAKERAGAIGIWSAMAGVAVASGPIVGGWLLQHHWWGSVFYVNVPVSVVAIIGVVVFVPESKDSHTPRFDVAGLVLSIVAVFALVYTIIEASGWGWLSARTLGGFALSGALLAAFTAWELRVENPMLPVRIFSDLRFSAASVSITAAFFALFGFIFLVTQYFQLVRGYSPLRAGVCTLPVAAAIATSSVVSPQIVHRVGTTKVVSSGLLLMSIAFAWIHFDGLHTPYFIVAMQMVVMGLGLGSTTACATESIMGSLSVDKAGVGSAVNDTTRELGGTLGVAVVGSVFTSVYVHSLQGGKVYAALPVATRHAANESVSAAAAIAGKLGAQAPLFITEVKSSFVSGFGVGCWVVSGVALAGSLFAARFLPSHATTQE
jgi:EmrB/QacA subfamily drug resistance transporter